MQIVDHLQISSNHFYSMTKKLFPGKIIWLASYPKSGNTWFRAFLTALLNDGKVEINSMNTDGIFSSREIFDEISDIDSRDVYEEEIRVLQPDIYRQLATERNQAAIIKIHDAYIFNKHNVSIVPDDVTHCAIYFIRNPLDIVGSLANHNSISLDQSVKLMNNPNGYLARQKNNLNTNSQLPQLLSDWSNHVNSWLTLPTFPVHIVRYEDMLTDTFNVFSTILQKVGWEFSAEQIDKAIRASSFDQLKAQETMGSFYEKAPHSQVFFRSGKMDAWKQELSTHQIAEITFNHKRTMKSFGYIN